VDRLPIAIEGYGLSIQRCLPIAIQGYGPSLVGHHSSDGTTAVGRLPIAIDGYDSSVQRRIVVLVLIVACDF
jgi:hypothetical protein